MPEVKVTIRSEDQGSANVKAFGLKLSQLGLSAMGLSAGLGVASAALGAVSNAARAAWAAIDEGASLNAMQGRFENLAESIGTTADALKGDLRDATQGMMSDAALVQSASDIISLGLAHTSEEAVRLGAVVGQLGWDMQVVTLTMANNSMMRLDNLGLSVETVKARMEELKAAGMDADAAFDMAVIEAGEAKIALLGNAADTTAGQIKILQASVENIQNAFQEGIAAGFADGLANVAAVAADAAPAIEEGIGALGERVGRKLGSIMSTVAADGLYFDRKEMEDQLSEMGVSWRELAQARKAAMEETGRTWGEIADGGEAMLAYEVAARKALEERYGLMLDLQNLNQRDDKDAAEMAANFDAQREAAIEAVLALYDYDDALEKVAETEDGVAVAASNVGNRIEAMAGLADVAAKALARGADKAGVMAGALQQLEGVASANKLDDAAAAAEALADAYADAAASMTAAFNAALEKGGAMDFGNLDKMAEAAWGIAQAFGLTVPQLGDIGIALGEITPDMAEAAAKAAIFQQAFGDLLGQFQAGNLDTSGFVAAYDALIADLQSKSLVEIQVELKQVANPARESWAWLPKEERTIEVPVEFKPEQAALATAIGMIDGIPDNNQKIVSFEAEYTEVTTAVTTIAADIAAIDATVLMTPETAAVDAAIERIDESRLTVYVDYVAGEPPVPPGRAVGGPVSGGSPYIVGEHGPELFVPWTGGTVVPNGRFSGTGDGGGISMVVNFYGPTSGADVAHAVDSAGRRLLQKMRQAGVPV